MLKILLFAYLGITLITMVSVAISLFYSAIAGGSIVDFVYGAALDLFACMLVFGKNTARIESVYIPSLVVVVLVAFSVQLYKKIKTPEVQD